MPPFATPQNSTAGRKLFLNENQVNAIGYRLLAKKRNKEVIEMFRMNVNDYRRSADVFGSLGGAHMINGEKDLAITNFRRSLELDPKNTHATGLLKQLENK